MATITKRGSGWFVQVRRKGYAAQYKTLGTKVEAQAWAREQERRVDQGQAPTDLKALRASTLGDVLRRYLAEKTPPKRSAESERLRLTKMLRDPVCDLSLSDLTTFALSAYRDRRLANVKPGTVRRELSLIHHALDTAKREWGVGLESNPVASVAQPALNNGRNRRLAGGELARLEAALARTRNELVRPVVLFAIETALRRAELLALEWRHIDLELRTAHIPWSKTGVSRTIPLTSGAIDLLQERSMAGRSERVFPITPVAFRLAWERARNRAGLVGLRFHDLRHEALSRFCELGLSIPELAVISGHKDPRMLFRYAHLRPADLAKKLSGRSWATEVERRT